MLRFVNAEYYRVVESGLNGLEMALNGNAIML